jgi:hypothetical protein
MSRAGHEARIRNSRVGKPEGKRSLGRPKPIKKGNIKTDLTEVGW